MKHHDSDPQPNPEDDRVGYGRPPRQHRFRKGQSGNPRGRPKGSLNVLDLLAIELNRKLTLREGDRTRVDSKLAAIIARFVESGLKGDPKVMMALIRMSELLASYEAKVAPVAATKTDQEILARWAERQRQTAKANGRKGRRKNRKAG
ncbi:DUF5681 domain-containing protein [Limibacillus sp. MBR-115]|jgi:hypothetical protein|uniref:DUF5681 domain-containing protein n=1 Tax=Limibacillus sp. MBR-115 TaxID=3156465 RepID=UPI00339887B2